MSPRNRNTAMLLVKIWAALILACILFWALVVWGVSKLLADTCWMPNVVTCSKPLNGAKGCNPDPPVFTCQRPDGSTYSHPTFSPQRPLMTDGDLAGKPRR